MAYATQENATDRYGEEFILNVADRSHSASLEAPEVVDAIAEALDDATAEVDSHIGARYDLPLPETPKVLVRITVDIGVYRLASEAGVLSDEIRQRYEDAVALLKRLAEGKASLGLTTPAPSTHAPKLVRNEPRVMTRGRLTGVV